MGRSTAREHSATGLATPEITVCVCTYRRPALLTRLLAGLEAQTPETPAFEIVVVDNDAAGSAEETVEGHARQAQHPVRYLLEPRQNISLARNRAVQAARGHWLALIDDDEVPAPTWLRELHATARQTRAPIVLGPVLPELARDAPGWIGEGGLFMRPRYPTGTVVPYMDVRTSNLLMRREVALSVAGPFDPDYGLSGGEDIMLLERLRQQGQSIVWCDQAPVTESIPAERANLGYILRRAYGGAQSYARVHRRLAPNPRARRRRTATLLARTLAMLPVDFALALLWAPLSRSRSARRLQHGFMQCGKLSALAGAIQQRYAAPQTQTPGRA